MTRRNEKSPWQFAGKGITTEMKRSKDCAGGADAKRRLESHKFGTYKVERLRPNPKANKNCSMCRGYGCYMALQVDEYEESLRSFTCACTNPVRRVKVKAKRDQV